MPVAMVDAPLPSRSIATSMSVSLVVRRTDALRMDFAQGCRFSASFIRRPGASPLRPENSVDGVPPRLMHGWALGRAFASCPRAAYIRQRARLFLGNRMQASEIASWHGTTIVTVRKGGVVAIGGDGQVTIGQTIVKANAKKVRRLGKGDVIGGFAGATADAFTLFERLESKLEQYPGQLMRAAVELAKDWRTDRYLRRLEAMMIVADPAVSLGRTGTGDVLEPEAGIMGIGSGGNYALGGARARLRHNNDAHAILKIRIV